MSLTLDLSHLTNEELVIHANRAADDVRSLDDTDSIAALDAALAELCRREELLG